MSSHPTPIQTGSRFIDEGKTPAEWVAILSAKGMDVKERTLREKANKLRACGKLGNEMLILPEQLDTMFLEDSECRSKSNSAENDGSLTVVSNSMAEQSPDTITTKALDRLQKQARSNGSKPKLRGKNVVTSLATKPNGSRS